MAAPETGLKNKLYYGDNLAVLRDYIPDQTVDLIYLDPPFNSRQDYNVLFAEKDGSRSASQITAFKDTWEWNEEAARSFEEVVEGGGSVSDAMVAFRTLLGGTDMLAYLAMMAPRLVELRRVLKETGSIYLHCDPTASHYLKLLMDSVFGPAMYRNEISWLRSQPKSHTKINFANSRDIILRYSKSDDLLFNKVYGQHDEEYVRKFYKHTEPDGRRYRLGDLTNPNHNRPNLTYEFLGVYRVWRWTKARMQKALADGLIVQTKPGAVPQAKRYLDTMLGQPVTDNWEDIERLHASHAERLGYPTQKPEALLERILKASSNEGDIVLDPFCGCGTTIQVAQKLNRRWIGIDITHLAIGLIKNRLTTTFGDEVKSTYEVIGEPKDLAGAQQLASENKFQFQAWALGLVDARVADSAKRGADRGVDGRKTFFDDNSGKPKHIIFSVKGGQNIGVSEVRDLIGVVNREHAAIGAYISFAEPSGPMKREAAEAGFYTSSDGTKYPRLQLLTIKGLLEGAQHLQRPLHVRDVTFKPAPKHRERSHVNLTLNLNERAADG